MSKQTHTLSYFRAEWNKEMEDSNLKTVPDYLRHYYEIQPEKEAIVFALSNGSREAVTYKDLYVNSLHVAKCLIKLGVMKSEFVAVSMRNSSKWLYAAFGAVMAGARPISMSFTYTDGSDVVAMMQKLGTCSLLFLDPGAEQENWNVCKKLIQMHEKNGRIMSEKMPYLRYLICHDRPKETETVLALQEIMDWETPEVTLPEIFPDDIFTLFQTSGSTGLPKAITHTHKSFIAGATHHWTRLIGGKDKIHFNDRPFTWIGGFPLTVVTGHTRVTRSGYCDEPEDTIGFLIDVISREKCNNSVALPPLLNALMERHDDIPEDWPLETILTGGQPITKAFAQCVGTLCRQFRCAYGSSEFLICTTLTVERAEDYQEYAIGYANPGVELKIVNDKGETVPTGEKGELYVKIDSIFKRYYNDPEKSKACFTDDGWYRTDDICYMKEDGLFFCVGRKSEMILSGGFNVAPAILELTLERCHGVARAVCVPVPHEILYQVVCACVILEDGVDLTEESIRTYCEDVHNDKPGLFTVLPTFYMFVKEFPLTSTGKTSRRQLTKMASEKFIHQHENSQILRLDTKQT